MSEEFDPNGENGVSTSPQLTGMRLGVYAIQDLLGRGGMADVYRGFDTNLQRAVAVKVLSPAAAAQPGFAERFRQEARLIANLRHPNIVQVYDFGEQDGHTYSNSGFVFGVSADSRSAFPPLKLRKDMYSAIHSPLCQNAANSLQRKWGIYSARQIDTTGQWGSRERTFHHDPLTTVHNMSRTPN